MKHTGVVMEGARFVLGVREVKGTITAEQGMVMFYAPDDGVLCQMPVYVPSSRYGEELTVCTHIGRQEIMTSAGDDDVLEANMKSNYIDLLTSVKQIENHLDTWKTSKMPVFITQLATFCIAFVLSFVSALLRIYPVTYVVLVALVPYYRIFTKAARLMETSVVWDSYGHWVDLRRGRTNLNGGYQLW